MLTASRIIWEQFAHMGADYAKKLLNLSSPRVALLSNGAERGKGSFLVKQVTHLLEESPLNFVGNVEPIDVVNHCADVVVCDGFSGNILLKSMEATAHMVKHTLAHELSAGGVQRDMIHNRVEEALDRLDSQFGEGAHSGARLLGVQGVVIVAHGSANGQSIARSIAKTYSVVQAEQ